jgi:ferric-dicitrate binding protein FerR (iron transport regulator)
MRNDYSFTGRTAVVLANSSTKRVVNLEEYVGWVNGMYIFNDRPLGDIMKTFERWYDIQVYYKPRTCVTLPIAAV